MEFHVYFLMIQEGKSFKENAPSFLCEAGINTHTSKTHIQMPIDETEFKERSH